MGGYEEVERGGVGDVSSQERAGLREDWNNVKILTWLLYMVLWDSSYDEQMPKKNCPSSSITEPTPRGFQNWRECVLPAHRSAPDDSLSEISCARIPLQLPEPCAPLS